MTFCVQKRTQPAKLFHSWLPHDFGLNTTPTAFTGFCWSPTPWSKLSKHPRIQAGSANHSFFKEKIAIGSSDRLELRVFGFFTRNSQLQIKKSWYQLISKKNFPELLMKPPVPTLFAVSIETTKSHWVSTKSKHFLFSLLTCWFWFFWPQRFKLTWSIRVTYNARNLFFDILMDRDPQHHRPHFPNMPRKHRKTELCRIYCN